jgi:hypothetical protein
MPVVNEPTLVAMKIQNHPLAVIAVVGAVEHFTQRAGLSAAEQGDVLNSAEAACRDALKRLEGSEGCMAVTLEDFSDRLEVSFEYAGGPLEFPSAAFDRVQSRTEGGHSRTTLVKFFSKRA